MKCYFFILSLCYLLSNSITYIQANDNNAPEASYRDMRPETKDILNNFQKIINDLFMIALDHSNTELISCATGNIARHMMVIILSFCKRCATRDRGVDKKILRALLIHMAENIDLDLLIRQAALVRNNNQDYGSEYDDGFTILYPDDGDLVIDSD